MIRSQDTHRIWYIVCTYTDFPSLCKGLKFTDVFNDLNLQLKKNDLKKNSCGLHWWLQAYLVPH